MEDIKTNMSIKKITFRLGDSDSYGFTHDSRTDVRNLAKVCNVLIDKLNELAEEVNKLKHSIG